MKYIKNIILLLILLFTFNINSQTCDTTFKSFTNVTNPASNSSNRCKARYITHKDNYPTTGKQTWYYEVYSGTPNVSHLLFAFPECIKIINFGNYTTLDSSTFIKKTLNTYKVSNAPTGLPGYKYNYGFAGLLKFYIVVDNIYNTDKIDITIKGGNSYDTKSFCGPEADCCALPIELLYKNIEETDGTDVITWVTATELNIDYYEVSLITSFDTIKLDTVLTYGVAYTSKIYTRTYNKQQLSNYYYKISSINYDGINEESIYLYAKNNKTSLNIFPNPTHNILNIPEKIGKNIIIYDSEGKVIYNDVILFKEIILDIAPGVYIILCDDTYTKVIFY